MSGRGDDDQIESALRALADRAGEISWGITPQDIMGAARHRRARTWEAVGALAVAAAVAAIFIAPLPQLHLFRRSQAHATGGTTVPPTTPTSTGAGTSVPPTTASPAAGKWQPSSVQWLSTTTAYVVETEPCGAHTCTRLLLTTDDGAHFRVQPAATTGGQFTFANLQDAYSVPDSHGSIDSSLFMSTDAGRSWHRTKLGDATTVYRVTTSRDHVYVTASRCTSAERCSDYRLYASTAGSSAWTSSAIPGTNDLQGSGVALGSLGPDVWVPFASGGPVTLLLSTDEGRSFTVESSDIAAVFCAPIPTSASVLWLGCGTGMMGEWWRSTDAGQSFTALDLMGNNGAELDAVTDSVAFFQNPDSTVLERTTNGGATFQRLASPKVPVEEGVEVYFGDPRHGFAVVTSGAGGVTTNSLWRTSDGGSSWVRLAP